jgi:phage portal protein BeeE
MSFIERIFNRPSLSEIKQLMDEVDASNQLYRAILDKVLPGTALRKDYHTKDYISDGYEKNADTFALIDRLSTMFSQIPIKAVINDEQIEKSDILQRIIKPNNYQIWEEFSKLWYTFYLVTGNAIIYAPRLQGGNQAGRIMPTGMYMVPTQHVEIISGGWRDPIKEYVLDIDTTERIPAEHIIHVRMPNLQYLEGANFMGMSPLKVAALIIEAENQGYQIVADTLAKGIPPGILTKIDATMGDIEEQQSNLKRTWASKYGNQKYRRTAGDPVMTVGDMKWIPIGFSNFISPTVITGSPAVRRYF